MFDNFIKLVRANRRGYTSGCRAGSGLLRKNGFGFFSSHPYPLSGHDSSLMVYSKQFNRRWGDKTDPHPDTNKLGIDSGHYGLYYTVFNQDSEKHRRKREELFQLYLKSKVQSEYESTYRRQLKQQEGRWINNIITSSSRHYSSGIARANQEIHSTIRSVSQRLMSVIINPSKLVSSVRAYHSGKVKQIGGGAPGTAAAEVIAATDAAAEVVAVPSAADIGDVVSAPSVSFESSFLQTQLSNINNIYNDKTADLNLIYPLYQALKRNLIPLPSVDYYNMVLDSIERRSLDNNCGGLACVENRLTTLLLVYQDLLESGLRPSIDTYNIVIGSLLKGALDAIKLGNQSNTPQFVYHNSFYKSQEFSQIGLDLLLTVKSKANQLDLNKILPNLLIIMNYHPNLVTKQFLDLLFDLKDGNFVANGEYHVGFLGLTKYFGKLKVFNDTNDDLFQFVISSYKCYQQHCQKYDHLIQNEYDVYSSLVQSLIENGNVLLATKFLDQILVDFKESLNSVDKPSKSQISKLLSTYLISLLNIDGSFKNLYRSYNLLQEFNSVAYLPELSVELYNEMINCFISYYTRLEAQKLNSCGPGSESEVYKVQQSQLKYYHIIWKLYNHLAIRKDYQSQQKPFDVVSIVLNNKKISCRDYLLSFSLDLGDHEKIFQLLKEIILKNHIIQDLTILEKLCQYLANGSKINSNSYYNELLWNLLEDQALHYSSNPTDLNSFLLEIVGYLVLESPDIQFNSTKRILDSQVVNNAVTNCDLQANNVYGIMKLLQSAMSTTTNINDHRMLHLVATMINKFEDSDNHYLAVDDEVSLFVEQMKKYFVNNYNSAVVHITHEMQYAALNLDLEDPTSSVNSSPDQMEFTNSWHTINLCFLLHTSMRVGVQRFVELFEQGYNFNYETWIIIINNRYEDLPIDTYDVTARILELSFSDVVKNDLIASLLALRLDHVITRVVKYLFQHPAFLRNDDLVHHVFDTLSSKTTEHLKKEIAANINTILEYNQTLKWVNKLSFILDSESFVELVKGNKLLFESKTEYTEDELIFLTRYLKSLIFIFKIDESKETLAKYFTKQSVSHYLKVNPEFLEMVTMHYLVSGSYKTILDTLSSVESTSLFTRKIFMLSRILSNQIYQGKDKCFDDLVLFGSRLLTLEPKRMVEIYRGSPFMHETPQLVSLMIQTLINCALLDKASLPKINMKLEKLFSFIHGTKYKVLDEKVLLKLIHLLTLLNRGDMLNFIVTHGLGSKAIHFRGFEFHIEDEPTFLALMEQAASQLNDAIMSSAIKEFQISLPSALPKTRQYNYELCI